MPHYFLAPFFLVPFEPAETQAVPAGGTAFVPQISASGSATAQVTLLVATAVGYSPELSAQVIAQSVPFVTVVSASRTSISGSTVAQAAPLLATSETVLPDVSAGVGAVVPAFGVAVTALPVGLSTSAVLIFPIAATVSGLSAPDVYAATTALAGTALSQGLLLSPAVAGSGNVIAPLLEAGGIFVAPAHIGGLTALLYELALNDIGVYALVAVDGITYVLPLNPEVVINLA